MTEQITIPEIDALFEVRLETGKLFWKGNPSRGHPTAGREAGHVGPNTKSGKCYCNIKIKQRVYRRSRLMFFYVNGHWPTPCVDHKDGNSLNDRPENLREATYTQNAQNKKRIKRRQNLPMGVNRVTNGVKYYAAVHYKRKSVFVGIFTTPDEAHQAYLAKKRELYGEFA